MPVAVAASEVEVVLTKGVFESEGIPFYAKNEFVQSLMGGGALGGYNLATGPVEFWVPAPFRESALALLRGVRGPRIPLVTCPACKALNPLQKITCPECGLHLG